MNRQIQRAHIDRFPSGQPADLHARPPVHCSGPRSVLDQADSSARSRGVAAGLREHENEPAPHTHRRASRRCSWRGSLHRLRARPERRTRVHPTPPTHRRARCSPRRTSRRRPGGSLGRSCLDCCRRASTPVDGHTVQAFDLDPTDSGRLRHPVAVLNVALRMEPSVPIGASRGMSRRCPEGEPANVCALDLPFRSDLGSRGKGPRELVAFVQRRGFTRRRTNRGCRPGDACRAVPCNNTSGTASPR